MALEKDCCLGLGLTHEEFKENIETMAGINGHKNSPLIY